MPDVAGSRPAPTQRVRLALVMATVCAAAVLAGCPPPPQGGPTTQPSLPTAQRPGLETPIFGAAPIDGGIYESLGISGTLAGDALARARMDRKAILALVQVKALPAMAAAATESTITPPADSVIQEAAASAAAATRPTDAQPPAMAVKYYLRGREQFLQGANSDAVDFLEKSLALDPNAFTVLRLMGRVCFASSQLARGSMYLERAQKLRPNDVEVNYLLGRYWLERKDDQRAIYYLMLAADSPEQQSTSTQLPLSAFYLARALQAGGFYRAAAKEFGRFMDLAAIPVPGYRYDRELSYLIDEQWATHLSVGENYSAAGDYAEALPHYRKAAENQPRDAFIASRLVNALAHTGKLDAARAAALALLAADRTGIAAAGNDSSRDDAIKLVAWAYRASGLEKTLISDLTAHLAPASPNGSSAVLTLAAAQDYLGNSVDAFKTLRTYLASHPTDLKVVAQVLKRVDSPATFHQALITTGAALAADRSLHDELLKLFDSAAKSAVARTYLKNAPELPPDNFAVAYLQAIVRRAQDPSSPKIEADFHAALTLAPDFVPARDAYVEWLLAREQFPKVTELVRQAVADNQGQPGEARAWELLIQSETAQQRFLSALKLAEDGHAKFPNDPEIRIELAAIYRLRGQDTQADLELQSTINDMPKYEPAYKALVNGILLETRRNGGGDSSLNALAAVLAKMTRELPDSRFGQINAALIFARSGRLDESENMLRRLLAETPDDPEVLVPLAQVRQALGRSADAIATLANPLKDRMQPELVRALAALYIDQDRSADALAMTQTAMEANPDAEMYAEIHAQNLNSQEKHKESISVLTAASKKFPHSAAIADLLANWQDRNDDPEDAVLTLQAFMKENGETAERLYSLAHYFSAADNDAASTAALQRVLAIMPDHTGANNDLGYVWADTGIHLEQAQKMIQKAVDNEPNNAAYQDSLGWVLYKQAKFAQAVPALEQAVALPEGSEPEGVQHLGDALYRAGRIPEAIEHWSQAQQMLALLHTRTKREKKINDYLEKAIADAKAGKAVETSPLAGPVPEDQEHTRDRSAGPTTVPAIPSQ